MQNKIIAFLIVSSLMIVTFQGCIKKVEEGLIEQKSEDEVHQVAENYIYGMEEYTEDNGYHLERIDTKAMRCPGCYEISYEYRRRAPNSPDVIGIANVIINFSNWEITGVEYFSDAIQDTPT